MLQKIVDILNDLRPKQLLILAAVAAVLMFLTIYLGMSLLTASEEKPEPDDAPPKAVIATTPVVVAKVNIPERTRIQESMLQMKELPVDMVPEGAIKNFDEVKDIQVKIPIFAGDTLTRQKLSAEMIDKSFAGAIPADCRAVSINVNEITGVAGFAKPGDKVDLLLVEKDKYSATTNILLQDVPLLSVNQDRAGDEIFDSAISNPTIATFALPPQDVLKLISASKLGEIYMMLRPANPRTAYITETDYYTIESINKPQSAPVSGATPVIPSNPDIPLPQIPAAPVTPKIEIILGDEIVQSAEEPANKANSALPAIPSGANQNFTAPPPPDVPLSNSPVVNSFYENLTK